MRFLNTHLPCKQLKQKLKNPPANEIAAKKAWRRFNKKDTRRACYKLQQGLCAYTELWLDSPLLGSHLEHIAPRSLFPERTFMADNLVLSVLSDDYSGALKEEGRFAGHFKKSQFIDDCFISPYDEDCERYFHYCPETGQVLPMQGIDNVSMNKTIYTIAVLNLNCDYLVNQRLTALETLGQKIKALLENHATKPHENGNTKQILMEFSEETLKAVSKKLPEFVTAKKQLFERYIESGALFAYPKHHSKDCADVIQNA